MKIDLKESGKVTYETDSEKSKVNIRLLSPGQGSSGFYSQEIVERDGSAAFPKGTFLYFNHESPDTRDIRDAFGALTEDARFVDGALIAEATIFSVAKSFVYDIMEHAELSIQAKGDVSEETGLVESINPHPYNAVALVPRGGRDGKIVSVIESYKDRKTNMDEKQFNKLIEAFTESVTETRTLIESLSEEKDDEKGSDEGVSASEIAEALIEADLPAKSRESVYRAVEAGTPLSEAIKEQEDLIKELKGELEESLKPGFTGSGSDITEYGLSW